MTKVITVTGIPQGSCDPIDGVLGIGRCLTGSAMRRYFAWAMWSQTSRRKPHRAPCTGMSGSMTAGLSCSPTPPTSQWVSSQLPWSLQAVYYVYGVHMRHAIVEGCRKVLRCLQPVCTTEIGRLALKYKELTSKGVKIATLSADPVSHCTSCLTLQPIPSSGWVTAQVHTTGASWPDPGLCHCSCAYNAAFEHESGTCSLRAAARRWTPTASG